MKKLMVVAMAIAAAASALCAEYRIKDGASNWADPKNYEPEGTPGASDVILVMDETTVYLSDSDAASVAVVNGVSKVAPWGRNATLEITVAGELTITTPITSYGRDWSDYLGGPLVKKGNGTLKLESSSFLWWNDRYWDYCGHIIVEAGEVAVWTTAPAHTTTQFGLIEVAEGATFRLPNHTAASDVARYDHIYGLNGAGTVVAGDSAATVVFTGADTRRFAFSGKMTGMKKVQFSGTNQNMTGNTSDFRNVGFDSASRTGFTDLGNYGAPGSFGNFEDAENRSGFTFYETDATIEYVGEGPSSFLRYVNIINFNEAKSPCPTISGGPHGGLTIGTSYNNLGSISRAFNATCSAKLRLAGDGENECVILGDVNDYNNTTYSSDCRNHTLRFVKEGAGKWRFADVGRVRELVDVLEINEGTLAVDTLDEQGARCAIGTSTNRTDGTFAHDISDHHVNYGFLMGNLTKDGRRAERAFLEYTGTDNARCSTREIALAGNGGLMNNGAATFKFANVWGLSADEMTFRLAGSGMADNEVGYISDGEGGGKVSVVKEGPGKWILSGEQTFGGDLVVTGGTLVVRKPVSDRYTWFRFTIKEGYSGPEYVTSATPHVVLEEVGLFDAEGNRVNFGLTSPDDAVLGGDDNKYLASSKWVNILPGEAAIEYRGSLIFRYGAKIEQMFDATLRSGLIFEHQPAYADTRQLKDPATRLTWIPIVMRLPAACTAEVAKFDYMNFRGKPASGLPTSNGYNLSGLPKMFTVEGSTDGLVWDELLDSDDEAHVNDQVWAKHTWSRALLDGDGKPAKYDGGFALAKSRSGRPLSVLENVRSVIVGNGATLELEQGSAAVELKSLKLDAASGGTVRGFTFAEEGEIEIENVTKKGVQELPVVFPNSTDLAKLTGWGLKVNGKDYAGRLAVSGDKVSLVPPGMVLIVR